MSHSQGQPGPDHTFNQGQPAYGPPPGPGGYPAPAGYGPPSGLGGYPVPAGYGQPLPPNAPHSAPPPQPYADRPGIMALRPNDVGEMVGVAFRGLRKGFWTSLLLPLVPLIIPVALVALVIAMTLAESRGHELSSNAIGGGIIALVIFAVVALFVLLVACMGGMIKAFAEMVLGRQPKLGTCLGHGMKHMLSLVAFGFLALLMSLVVLLPLIIVVAVSAAAADSDSGAFPALVMFGALATWVLFTWLVIKLAFAPYVIVMEQTGPITGMKRSWSLTRGRWWATFGAYLLGYLTITAITYAVQFALYLVMIPFILSLSSTTSNGDTGATLIMFFGVVFLLLLFMALVSALAYPFMTYVMGAAYLDARMRKENLAPTLAAAAAPQGPAMSGHSLLAPGQAAGYPPAQY